MALLRSSSVRDISVQRYERFANAWATARPIPRLPPVMRTWRARDDIVAVMEVDVEIGQ